MMNDTPRVRSATAPTTPAATPAQTSAAGQAIQAASVPGMNPNSRLPSSA